MSYFVHHPDKWVSANIDLIEECLEKHDKTVVIIAGASSSGKSYCSSLLAQFLKAKGHHPLSISLDSYNFGLSGIISNKVNLHYFNNSLKDIRKIASDIKSVITDIPFDKKYDEEALVKIEPVIAKYFNDEDKEKFLKGLHEEWKVLNFDEPTVYDMEEASQDVHTLLKGGTIEKKKYSKVVSERVPTNVFLDGKECDVIIMEGIYALTPSLVKSFDHKNLITNFIDSDPKTLYLRRIIRDAKETSASSVFTTSLYFKYIVPSYINTILPNKDHADVVFVNDMTFMEMKEGTLYTTKMEMQTKSWEAIDHIIRHSKLHKITYEKDTYFTSRDEPLNSQNILRLRCYSDDEGKTYIPSSLVHKGLPKVRRDGKSIRPINVLIKEGDFFKVWPSEMDCLQDFAKAGCLIGPVQKKIKWKIEYKNQNLTIRYVEGNGYFVEFDKPYVKEAIDYTKNTIARYENK
jgi:uridine kinase